MATAPASAQDALELIKTRRYIALLLLAALIGVPVSAGAYYFLWLLDRLPRWVFTELPKGVGFDKTPPWWPLLPLFVAGVLTALAIRYLPGRGGHSPAGELKAGGVPTPSQLPGILLAAVASVGLGAVVGPEAPLLALGPGFAALVVRLAKKDAPAQAVTVVGAAGGFGAVSALLGSPLLGAFLLMEAIGLGGEVATLVLMPGLLAAGVGFLMFIGLDSLTGLGTFSLSIPNLPHFARPNGAELGWALVIGAAAPLAVLVLRALALVLRSRVERRTIVLTPVAGLAVAGLAIAYHAGTGKSVSDVLFSGQTGLPVLLQHSSSYAVGALALLLACKGLGYAASMSAFRGGPTFPAMYIGAAGGVLMSHLPGLPLVPAVAIGIGAMTSARLRLPLTSVLLATLLLASDGLAVMPLVIVAVVVSYVLSVRLDSRLESLEPASADPPGPAAVPQAAQAAQGGATDQSRGPAT